MKRKLKEVLRMAYGVRSTPVIRHTPYAIRRSAFTLIELMVVVAIMGIVLTISVPFMNTAITGNKGINGAMRMMQEACADARALAILKHATATLTVNSDGNIDVREGGTGGRTGGMDSPDVAGNEWRMADRPASSGGGGGGGVSGRVEMRHKYPVKLPSGVGIEAILANGMDATEAERAEVRFYADGTSDEFNLILTEPATGENRQVWLEITTGLPDIETDRTKFRLH